MPRLFNPLILHKDCFEGGSDRLFDHVAASPTRRNFMAYSVAAAAAAASVSAGRAAPTVDAGAEVIFKGGKIIPVPAPRR